MSILFFPSHDNFTILKRMLDVRKCHVFISFLLLFITVLFCFQNVCMRNSFNDEKKTHLKWSTFWWVEFYNNLFKQSICEYIFKSLNIK